MSLPTASDPHLATRNARLALVCLAIFAVMVGVAFAAAPLYRAFCQATGFNGTVRRVATAPTSVAAGMVVVAFDTNVRGLAWQFTPNVPSQQVRPGATNLAFFKVTNTSDQPLTGRAVYNVTPESAGAYFSKLECFCFKNQTIQPGQTVQFPVVYFVDPRYARGHDPREAGEITLSYTFFPAVTGERVAVQRPNAALGGPAEPRL
jgi:cytochrome c oxidase assembly protein subunit 11